MNKVILNFSHPLSRKALQQLRERFGAVEEVRIPVQVDLSESLPEQVAGIMREAHEAAAGRDIAAVVPPGLSYVATFLSAHVRAPMVVLIREGTPPVYVVSQVVPYTEIRS